MARAHRWDCWRTFSLNPDREHGGDGGLLAPHVYVRRHHGLRGARAVAFRSESDTQIITADEQRHRYLGLGLAYFRRTNRMRPRLAPRCTIRPWQVRFPVFEIHPF